MAIIRKRFKLIVVLAILCIATAALAQGLIKGFDRTNRRTVAVNVDAFGNLFTGAWMDAPVDDDSNTACANLAAASTAYTLPAAGHAYTVCCSGNTCYLMCGAAPTAGTAANQHFVQISAGSCLKMRLAGPVCDHIAPAAVGQICFTHHIPAM